MSPNTNPVMNEVVPVEGLPEGLPETEIVEQPAEQQPAPKKKTALARLAGLLLVVCCALPLFLSVNYVVGTNVQQATLLNVIKELLASEDKLLGVLPVLAMDKMAALGLYALILGLVLGAVFGLLTLLTGKKCLLRVGTFFTASSSLAYALSTYLTSSEALDVIVLAVFAVSFLFYVILSFNARGKKAFGAIVNFVVSIAVVLTLVLCGVRHTDTFNNGMAKLGVADADLADLVRWAILGIALLSGLYTAIRMQTEKGRGFDLFRAVVMFILSAFVLVLGVLAGNNNNNYLICAGVAVVLSLLQIVVLANKIKKVKKALAKVEEVVEETVEEVVEAVEEEFIREEFAEATPYEGGPVEGVVTAEEVNPTFTESDPLPEVRTAGYDFYNSKSFDPFIAILNTEERNQFTELFILKYKGVMPEIPDYVVGGDNKEFFRKLFIYLGQYRDRIPDALLAKIYQFAIKLQ